MDILAASTLGRLWIMMLWTFVCNFLFHEDQALDGKETSWLCLESRSVILSANVCVCVCVCVCIYIYIFYFIIIILIFGHTSQHVDLSSLTRDGTWAPMLEGPGLPGKFPFC